MIPVCLLWPPWPKLCLTTANLENLFQGEGNHGVLLVLSKWVFACFFHVPEMLLCTLTTHIPTMILPHIHTYTLSHGPKRGTAEPAAFWVVFTGAWQEHDNILLVVEWVGAQMRCASMSVVGTGFEFYLCSEHMMRSWPRHEANSAWLFQWPGQANVCGPHVIDSLPPRNLICSHHQKSYQNVTTETCSKHSRTNYTLSNNGLPLNSWCMFSMRTCKHHKWSGWVWTPLWGFSTSVKGT